MNPAVNQLRALLAAIQQTPLDRLSVNSLANCLQLSRWQLQRTFSAHTGMQLRAHLQAYRLSRSAEMLVDTKLGILDVALEAGFGSQEAFSRAFKARYRQTPNQYRKRNKLDHVSFELFIPKERKWSKAMNIQIVHKPALNLHGHAGFFNGVGMEDANNFEVIPSVWEHFNHQVHSNGRQKGESIQRWYGLISESDQPERGALRYLASYDRADGDLVLDGGIMECVEAQAYAVLPHHGRLQDLGETLAAFFGEWLPNSSFKMAHEYTIEVYDERFNPDSDDSYFETWVPVQKHS